MLDPSEKPPAWAPEENIRLDFSLYGFDQLIGAIKVRVEKLGGKLRKEDVLTRAKRAEADSAARAERELILIQKGSGAAREERDTLVRSLQEQVTTLNREVSRIGIKFGCDSGHICTIATSAASINFYLHVNGPSKGEIIEDYRDDQPYPSCLIFGRTQSAGHFTLCVLRFWTRRC